MNPIYVKSKPSIDPQTFDSVTDALNREYKAHKAEYERFQEMRENAVVSPSNVRYAMAWTVVTIKTDTKRVDGRTSMLLSGDFSNDKKFVENSTDGKLKWEKVHGWLNSQIPEKVAQYLQNSEVEKAHALLAGRDPETGNPVTKTYLRTCKASLVLYLLGFERMCMDSRNFRTFKPVLREIMYDIQVKHPESEGSNPYRSNQPSMDAGEVSTISHSSDPEVEGKTFWEDKLKWNPKEYHYLSDRMLDIVAENCKVPKWLIPIVAFNSRTDRTTIHETAMNRLQEA